MVMNVMGAKAQVWDKTFPKSNKVSIEKCKKYLGEVANSKYFSEDAYKLASEPKELYIVKGAGYVDLYDWLKYIPFDKIESFFRRNLK